MTDTLEKTDTRQAEVQDALATILSDDKFVAAPQMTAFLRYVVQQTLDGQSNRIKAYTVAVDALGKPPTFDPQNDPSVRVLAKRLRSSLDQYYERNPEVALKIEMKAGSYVPAFIDNKDDVNLNTDLTVANLVSKSESAMQNVDTQKIATAIPPLHSFSSTSAQRNSEQPQPSLTSTGISSHPTNIQVDTGAVVSSSLNNESEKNSATAPLLTNTANKAPITNTDVPISTFAGKLSRIPRLALALPVLVGIFWFAANKESVTDSRTLAAAMPEMTTQSAPANEIRTLDISRSRPTIPTILITTDNATAYPCHLVADTLSTAFLASNTVDIYRETSLGNIKLVWPEDYQLNVSSVKVGDQASVSVQLLQAQSGRVIQADTILLNASAESGFSIENMDTIEAIASSFIETNSPMMQSFNSIKDDYLQADQSNHDI